MSKRPQDIISDEEVKRVHAHANFGSMTPRAVLADGVWKYSMGYTGGATQLAILREHHLVTKPKPGSYQANLTVKGKRYLRSLNPANPADWMDEQEEPTPEERKRRYMGQVMAECDCSREWACEEAQRCLAIPDFLEEMQQ